MTSRIVSRFVFLLVVALGGVAQNDTSAAGKDYSFTVPATPSWTDTGIDLASGDLAQVSGGTVACEGNSDKSKLPMPSAPLGSLLAKVHTDAAPVLATPNAEISASDSSHLYLGINGLSCNGSVEAKVHVGPAKAGASAANQTQAERLKSQLGEAAQIFMQGQFGLGGNNATGANNAVSGSAPSITTLKVSDTALDSTLRKDIDGLPRRVNDQFKNLGDMVNFVLVGSESQVKAALDAANWHIADTSDTNAVLSALSETYENKDYLTMPMSTLYLFGRKQDYGYEMAEPIAMVASRHHFRLWKAPFTWNGTTVWVGAGTHDIGFAKDKRNGSVTHKIDPQVDGERTNIGQSLDTAGKIKSMTYYLPPNPVQGAKNATGDGYSSDGRLLVMFLK